VNGFNPKEIFDQIYDTENRQKWDTVTTNLQVLDSADDGSEVIHFIIRVKT
jgi:hypothetical protein